jgi:APA family basic amino acid/polyamine antiporter
MSSSQASSHTATLVRGLGLTAAIAIVIGDVIGTGVYLKARVMTCNVGTPELVIAAWVVAGLLSLAGALTYAELGAMMPATGGEYVFMREAFGRAWAFLFGWMRFFIGSTGGCAALASGLAIFVNVLTGGLLGAHDFSIPLAGTFALHLGALELVAVAAIVVATLANCAEVAMSGRIATLLSSLKVGLIVSLGAAAFLFGHGDWSHFAQSGASGTCEGVAAAARGGLAGFGAAMMAALWAYNGWNELTYVSGEIANPQRNIPRALVGGIGIVGLLYVFVNASYFFVLPPTLVASLGPSSSAATETAARFLGPYAGRLMAAVLAMSIASALLVATLVSARIPYAMAADGLFFSGLARVSPRTRVPVRALIAQAAWTILLVLSGSFDALTDYTIFAILAFSTMLGGSLFLHRIRRPDVERPYRTWGYPVVPALFLLVTVWLVVNTLMTAPGQALTGLGLIALGVPFYWYWSRRADRT